MLKLHADLMLSETLIFSETTEANDKRLYPMLGAARLSSIAFKAFSADCCEAKQLQA